MGMFRTEDDVANRFTVMLVGVDRKMTKAVRVYSLLFPKGFEVIDFVESYSLLPGKTATNQKRLFLSRISGFTQDGHSLVYQSSLLAP